MKRCVIVGGAAAIDHCTEGAESYHQRRCIIPPCSLATDMLQYTQGGDCMDFILEFIFEIYLELMLYIVPEEKTSSKKYRIISATIAVIALLGILALFIWGCVLIVDCNNMLGLIPIITAIILSFVQIIAGFVLHDRKTKK